MKTVRMFAGRTLLICLCSLVILAGCNQTQPTEVAPKPTQPVVPTVEISQPTAVIVETSTPTPEASKIDPAVVAKAFVDENTIQKNILDGIVRLGLKGASVELQGDSVRVTYEQPGGLLPAELRLGYLTIFNTASRFAPFSKKILIVITIASEPYLGLQVMTEDMRAYRQLAIDEDTLMKSMVVFSPEEIP